MEEKRKYGLERIEGMEFWLHENLDDHESKPVRLVMAMSSGDKVFCHRASDADNGICSGFAEKWESADTGGH